MYHLPVLYKESLDALEIKPNGVYVDLTFGGGGHSRGILERLGKDGKLLSFDQDADAPFASINDKRFTFVRSNFRFLSNFLKYHNIDKVDGILADLGLSSHHLDDESRGFSFRFDAELDMRMNAEGGMTASDILNQYSEERLADIFYYYGELQQSRRLAKSIVLARQGNENQKWTTERLGNTISKFINKAKEKKELSCVYQALRIEVNGELEVLKKMLKQTLDCLSPDGRVVVISYHSLEDRLVKNFFKSGNFEGKIEKDNFGWSKSPIEPIKNKAILPTEEEIIQNPRARSAKLRSAKLMQTR